MPRSDIGRGQVNGDHNAPLRAPPDPRTTPLHGRTDIENCRGCLSQPRRQLAQDREPRSHPHSKRLNREPATCKRLPDQVRYTQSVSDSKRALKSSIGSSGVGCTKNSVQVFLERVEAVAASRERPMRRTSASTATCTMSVRIAKRWSEPVPDQSSETFTSLCDLVGCPLVGFKRS